MAAAAEGRRLDHFLADQATGLSRSRLQDLIRQGLVRHNGGPARAGRKLKAGDVLAVTVPAPEQPRAEPEDIPLAVVYEDEYLLVVDKPRGLVVHPAAGHARGTLVNALLAHCHDLTGVGDALRPGIVHRLDKGTTGLLVVAKGDLALHRLQAALARRELKRTYLALVKGYPPAKGRVEAPIGRHPVQRKRMAVVEKGGRPAVTLFTVVETLLGYSLLEVELETGRTHQIRVHLAFTGHPVAGDATYGGADSRLGLTGQALHAWKLEFAHPITGVPCAFTAPPPADFAAVLERLRAGGRPSGSP